MNARKSGKSGNKRMGGHVSSIFKTKSSPTSPIVHLETEYDRNLKPSAIDTSSLPSFNKNHSTNSTRKHSDNDDVMIINDSEVTSTVEIEKPCHRKHIRLSASSLPSVNPAHISSSSHSSHNQVQPAHISSSHTHNQGIPTSVPSSNQAIHSSSSDQSNKFVKQFANASKDYYKSVNNEMQQCDNSRGSSGHLRNPFAIKKNTRQSSPSAYSFSDDNDEDFLPSNKSVRTGTSQVRRSTRNDTKKFYGNQGLPTLYKDFTRKKLSNVPTRPAKPKLKFSTPSGPGATEDDPVYLDDNEDNKATKKQTKLHARPTLSSRKDFGVVRLKIKEMKFGSMKTNRAKLLTINDNDEIFIDFEDVRGETKMTFIHFHDTVLIKVNIHKEPFLIIIEPKSIVFSRLNTFFSSINNCRPGPLSMHNDKSIIVLLDEGLSDPISIDQFNENLKNFKLQKSYNDNMSDAEIQEYLDKLSQEIESEDPLIPSTSSVVKLIPNERPPRRQRNPPPLPLGHPPPLPLGHPPPLPLDHPPPLPLSHPPPLPLDHPPPLPLGLDHDPPCDPMLYSWPKTPDSKTSNNNNSQSLSETIPDSSTFSDNESVLTYTFQNFKMAQFVITGQDLSSLEPECYLNDQIINFYLRFYWDNNLNEVAKETVYVFSTFFFSRLVNTSRDNVSLETPDRFHNRVQSWTKGVNIFHKQYVLVPVCQRSHWFIVIMCHLGDYDPEIHHVKKTKPALVRKRKRASSGVKKMKKFSPVKEKPDDVEVVITDLAKQEEECVVVENKDGEDCTVVEESKTDCTVVEKKADMEREDDGQDCTVVEQRSVDVNTAINEMRGLGDDKESVCSGGVSDSISYMSVSEGSHDLRGAHDLFEEMEVDQKESNTNKCHKEKRKEEEKVDSTVVDCVAESSPERVRSEGDESGEEDGEACHHVVSSSQEMCVTQSSQNELNTKPCLLVLDSMLIKRRAVGNYLKKYLTQEYRKKYPDEPPKDFSGVPVNCPSVPAQNNGFDCGVYMLTYIESFFKHIEEGKPLPIKDEWTGGSAMDSKRTELKCRITSLSATTNQADTNNNNATS